MIVLDTNVISEIMSDRRDPAVVNWLNGQGTDVWTTTVTIYEVRFGLTCLQQGRKRQALTQAFDRPLKRVLRGRILDFNEAAANETAVISGKFRAIGRPIDIRDAMIAGIVAAQPNATLATRNTRHFADTGIILVDPWSAAVP